MSNNVVERLRDIQSEMQSLLEEADRLIRQNGSKMTYARAKSYWLAHVEMGLSNNHGFVGGSGCSMDHTIEEMDASGSNDEQDACKRCGPNSVCGC